MAGNTPVLVHNYDPVPGTAGVHDFRGGDYFLHEFDVSGGRVTIGGNVTIDGGRVTISNLTAYGTEGLDRGSIGAGPLLRELNKVAGPAAASQGFTSLRIEADRVSGPAGHKVDFTIDLKKFSGC